jgi:aerobic-type carbon monoxide dehydrogenase small subunit (CoxS/CutS family)
MADETTPQEKPEENEEERSATNGQVTRRQFLVGAGVGAVVGIAGTAGILTLARTTTTPVAQVQPPTAPQPSAPSTAKTVLEGKQLVALNVNGREYQIAVEPQTTLYEALKRDLGLTGVKLGCNGSMCSACSVLVDGVVMNSCSLLAIREQGKKIITIEGLEQNGKLHPVQVAFWDNQGYQCGFCTPGQILGAVELLSKNKNPTEDQIRAAMSGHMCKCSAYPNIIRSVQAAAKAMA